MSSHSGVFIFGKLALDVENDMNISPIQVVILEWLIIIFWGGNVLSNTVICKGLSK